MKCKKGDLARITQAINPANIGKIVHVDALIGRYKLGESFNFRGVHCPIPFTDYYWWIEAEHGLTCKLGDTPKAYIADSWLEPIRPDNVVETEEENIELEV